MRRYLRCAFLLGLVATTLTGCSAIGLGDPGGYKVTAYFARTPALYEKSRVKVMGADVGSITKIAVDGQRVRVELAIQDGVPLPPDVHAAIVPINTLGERNIVLYPAWKSGQPKLASGARIPPERTELPVEIDEALAAFTRLAESLDPDQLGEVVHRGAVSLEGRGPTINRALQSTAEVTHNLAAQDQRLISVAKGLRRLAAGLNKRESQLATTIEAFRSTSTTLAGERAQLTQLLSALELLVNRGHVLVDALQRTIPSTTADLSELVLTVKANSTAVASTITGLAGLTDQLIAAWDRKNHLITVRILLSPTVRAWLQPVFDRMGWGRVPCSPEDRFSNCPPRRGGR